MINYDFWNTDKAEYITVNMPEEIKHKFMEDNPHLREVPFKAGIVKAIVETKKDNQKEE